MNRARLSMIALASIVAALAFLPRAAASRCSFGTRYPPAIGRRSFIMARATDGTVSTAVGPEYSFGGRTVPAQVMRVDRVAGMHADAIRAGLRSSRGEAVFVRYKSSITCGPFPALDGALDRVGTSGLYAGVPRPTAEWIDGRPTFDVFRADEMPLPDAVVRPTDSAHRFVTMPDSRPTMSAAELFEMYGSLWAESVSIGDTSVWIRARNWIARNPGPARKHPAAEVVNRAVTMVEEVRTYGDPVPLGGTFRVTAVVPPGDSLVLYARTPTQPRIWMFDVTKDSVSGLLTRAVAASFAVDLSFTTTASALRDNGYASPGVCARIPIIVDRMPIVPEGDSAWGGSMNPLGLEKCAPEGSALRRLLIAPNGREVPVGNPSVTFRKDPSGRAVFELHAERDGQTVLTLRGEWISRVTDGPPGGPP